MRPVTITDFKARCLSLLQELQEDDEPLIVTKRGKPFAEVHACRGDLETVMRRYRGSVIHYGDIVSPVDEQWDADR